MIEHCFQSGCMRRPTIDIHLSAADGEFDCRSCQKHALQFHEWVARETMRQHGDFTAKFVSYDEIDWMNT